MEECAICLDPLKTDLVVLHCFHKFHTKCIIKNKKYSHQCPICRNPMITISRVDYVVKNGVGFYEPHIHKTCNIL